MHSSSTLWDLLGRIALSFNIFSSQFPAPRRVCLSSTSLSATQYLFLLPAGYAAQCPSPSILSPTLRDGGEHGSSIRPQGSLDKNTCIDFDVLVSPRPRSPRDQRFPKQCARPTYRPGPCGRNEAKCSAIIINARAEAEAVGYWYRLPRQTVYHLDRRREACEGILIKRLDPTLQHEYHEPRGFPAAL